MKERGERHPELAAIERKIEILEESAAAIDELYRLDQLKEERDAIEADLENTESEQP